MEKNQVQWKTTTIARSFSLPRIMIDPRNLPEEQFSLYSIPGFDSGENPESVFRGNVDSGKLFIESPSVLVSTLNPRINRVQIAQADSYCSPEFAVLTPRNGTHLEYSSYLFRTPIFKSFLDAIAVGSTGSRKRADKKALATFTFTLPRFETQHAIADYLDRETSEIDAMLEKLEGLSQLLEERFHQQLVKAIRGTNAPFIELGVVADIALGKMIQPNKKNPSDVQANYLRAAHVQPGGRLDFDVAEQQMWFDPAELSRLDLRAGDVVIVEGGAGYGRSVHLETNLVNWGFQNSINRVRPHTNKLIGKFIHYALHLALISGEIEMEVNTATIPHFTAEKVARFRIPLPPSDEQKKIVKHLDETIARIENMKNKVATLRSLLQERRSALITAAVTGQIEV